MPQLVLRDNYLQTQCISVTERLGTHMLDRLGRYARALERAGKLDRDLEFLPDDEELADRFHAGHGKNPYDEVTRTFLILFDGAEPLADTPHTARQARIFDIGPTVLARAGIPIPEAFTGIDLLGERDPPAFAFTECYVGRVVRGEGHKLIDFDFSHVG